MTNSLPSDCLLRPAKAEDIWTLRRLVLSAFLEPTQLRWQQFWVIEREGETIACGQLRSFEEAQELGSLVVIRRWRNRGLGTYLSKHLLQISTKPLYLECLGSKLATFYSHLGFVSVSWQELPPSLKAKFRLTTSLARVLGLPLNIMQYQDSPNF